RLGETYASAWRDDPRFKICLQGFAIVPTLIAHLDDDRLTRTRHDGKYQTFQFRVRDLVSEILQTISGEDLGDARPLIGPFIAEKAVVEAWWKEARVVGEETYFVRKVLGESADAPGPNQLMLKIITQKYPQHLTALYRKILEGRSKASISWLAEAVAESSLPREQQRELFLAAAASKNLDHRYTGLAYLKELD